MRLSNTLALCFVLGTLPTLASASTNICPQSFTRGEAVVITSGVHTFTTQKGLVFNSGHDLQMYNVYEFAGLTPLHELKTELMRISDKTFQEKLKFAGVEPLKDSSNDYRGNFLCKYELDLGKRGEFTFGIVTQVKTS